MVGKLSIIGAVAVILMIPTALFAQMGGAVNSGVHVGGAVNPGATVLAQIWGLGARRVGKFTAVVTIVRPPQSSAGDGADHDGQTCLLVGPWSGAKRRWIEAARRPALGCFVRRRYSDCGVDRRRNVSSVGQPVVSRPQGAKHLVGDARRLLKSTGRAGLASLASPMCKGSD